MLNFQRQSTRKEKPQSFSFTDCQCAHLASCGQLLMASVTLT